MSKLYPLSDCRGAALSKMVDTLLDYEMQAVSDEEARVWRALALMCDDELRFRNPRRKPLVPR